MNRSEIERAAKTAVKDILKDISGRGGAEGWWDGIDPDVKAEIRKEWTAIIVKHTSKVVGP